MSIQLSLPPHHTLNLPHHIHITYQPRHSIPSTYHITFSSLISHAIFGSLATSYPQPTTSHSAHQARYIRLSRHNHTFNLLTTPSHNSRLFRHCTLFELPMKLLQHQAPHHSVPSNLPPHPPNPPENTLFYPTHLNSVNLLALIFL